MLKIFRFIILLFGAFCVCLTEAKADEERFTVEVNVDVTDENASMARERALREANRAALSEVAKRITTDEGVLRLTGMTDDQLVNFIKEVFIIDEKSSAVRYIANLKVVINEDILKQYMQERQIPLILQSNLKVLVIPLFRVFNTDPPMLWESDNLWRQAWESAPRGEISTFISLPANGANYEIVDVNRIAKMDSFILNKLKVLNHVDEVYVLDAVYDGIEGLIINSTPFGGETEVIRVSGDRSSGIALFNKAVAEMQNHIEQKQKQKSLVEASLESEYTVMFSFRSLREWVEAQQALSAIPYIKTIEVQAMGSNLVQFKLTFMGSAENFLYALREKHYNLREDGKFFILEKV